MLLILKIVTKVNIRNKYNNNNTYLHKLEDQDNLLRQNQNYNQHIKNDILKLKDFVDKLNEEEKQMNDFINKSLFSDDLIYKNLQQTIINPEKISKHQVN